MKKNQNIYKLRCENIDDEQFENLLEEDLSDIEDFLNSYVVSEVDEKKIESTIDMLKVYMPTPKIEAVTKKVGFLERIKNNIDLIKYQCSLFSKVYLIVSLLLILVGTISISRLSLSIYVSAGIIAPIPILLGIFEIIKGREENVWELELSYKYSLREIVLSKLIIINIFSIALSIIISFCLANTYSDINLLRMISIWLIPIFLVSSISLIITSTFRGINSISLCVAVWILGIMGITVFERIVNISDINTFIVLGVAVLLATISSKIFYKKSVNSIDLRTIEF